MTTIRTQETSGDNLLRVTAFSGLVFSILFILSLYLIRMAVPSDPMAIDGWQTDIDRSRRIGFALNLIPFSGIAFLWFMAVLRHRIGLHEDRLLSTVFLGSGWLFIAIIFVAAAISQALHCLMVSNSTAPSTDVYHLGRQTAYVLLNVFGMKVAAVFIFTTSSIGLRTGVLARWVSIIGYVVGVVLILLMTEFLWIGMIFPAWVLLISGWMLFDLFRRRTSLLDQPSPKLDL